MNKTDALISQLFESMGALRRSMHGSGEPLLSQFKVTRPQKEMLFLLMHQPGMSITELASATGVTNGAATQTVDVMVRRELVERKNDPSDRRVSHLHLTTSGQSLADDLRHFYLDRLKEVTADLSEEELGILLGAVRKLQALTENRSQDKS